MTFLEPTPISGREKVPISDTGEYGQIFHCDPSNGQSNIYNDTCNEEIIFYGLIMNVYNLKWKQCTETDPGNWKSSINDPKCFLHCVI